MKHQLLLLSCLLIVHNVASQTTFSHVTSAANTRQHITALNHPELNGRPNAMIFVSPVWEQVGDLNPQTPYGVWYDNSQARWTIFNQNTQIALSATPTDHYRYNVLVMPGNSPNTFTHTVATTNKTQHITTLDHPALNNNPAAIILVTQRYGVYNNHEIGVWYDAGRWKIFNQDKAELPLNAQFNVLIGTGGGGITGATAMQHTHTTSSQLPTKSGFSAINNAVLNNNANHRLFVTQRWIGAYNPFTYNIWYDSPIDGFPDYRNGSWFIYNSSSDQPMLINAAFNMLAIPNNEIKSQPLFGWVDMHTHPMSQFGFGREFFFGNIDGDPNGGLRNCNCTHGFVARIPGPLPFTWIYPTGSCEQQNVIRNQLIDVQDPHPKRSGDTGWDDGWPKQSYVSHQQMWWEWLDRTRRGGLKTIVALAQNSHALADGMETKGPYDDSNTMGDQIRELKAFVSRHTDVMQIVTSATEMRTVVQSGRLAVIIGLEMDNIGNFYSPAERRSGEVYKPNPNENDVKNEIDRLYNLGVRYIFPIHIVNNVFGGAAVYGDDIEPLLFNLSNFYMTGSRFSVETVFTDSTGIAFKEPDFDRGLSGGVRFGLDVLRNLPGVPLPPSVMNLPQYSYIDPGPGRGHRNVLGLTDLGKSALQYMMHKGMMVDIDHMSDKAVTDALAIGVRNDYPLNSGHNGPRGAKGNEKARTDLHYDTIKRLGGMVGVGTGSTRDTSFAKTFKTVLNKMGNRNVAIGTDVHVGAKLPLAPSTNGKLTSNLEGLEICCKTGTNSKRWDFNTYNNEGVAHYGLMPEFLQSVRNVDRSDSVNNVLMSSVEYFAQMWEKCERRGRALASGPNTFTPSAIGVLCPTNKTRGDANFGGGPMIGFQINLNVSADGSRVEAVVSFKAEETKDDNSTVEQTFTQTVFTAPATMKIAAVSSVKNFNISFRGPNAGPEFVGPCNDGQVIDVPLPTGGMLQSLQIIGDTGGDDISNDRDCKCDSQVRRIAFNPITVVLAPR